MVDLSEVRWITSDHHFGHTEIVTLAGRPFKNTADMDEQLAYNWNSIVAPDDLVLHLGDFAFAKHEEDLLVYRKRLNGRIAILMGNHDLDYVKNLLRYGVFEHKVAPGTAMQIGEFLVELRHHPKNPEEKQKGGPAYVLHGHTHRVYKTGIKLPGHVNMCVEAWSYRPAAVAQVLGVLRRMNEFSRTRVPACSAV